MYPNSTMVDFRYSKLHTSKAASFSTLTFPRPPWAWPILKTQGNPPPQTWKYTFSEFVSIMLSSHDVSVVLKEALLHQWKVFFSKFLLKCQKMSINPRLVLNKKQWKVKKHNIPKLYLKVVDRLERVYAGHLTILEAK